MLRNSKGLTFVELMVVLAIIGILSTMAIPMLGLTPRAQLKKSARDIVSNLQAVRINALRDGKNWQMVFDADNKEYKSYYFDLTTKQYKLAKTFKLSDSYGSSRIVFGSGYGNHPESNCGDPAGGMCFGSSENKVTFTSLGTANACSMYIMDNKSKDTMWIVIATTGRIRMKVNFDDQWEK